MEKEKYREERLSFIVYFSWAVTLFPYFNDTELGQFWRIVFSYQKTGIEPMGLSEKMSMAFSQAKDTLDRDHESWIVAREKRSKAGKKGMKKRWEEDKQKSTKTKKKLKKSILKKYNNVIKICNINNNVMKKHNKAITMLRENITVNVNVNGNVNVNENEYKKLSLSQSKFKLAFPNKIIDCEFPKKCNVNLLIQKIKEQPWLTNEGDQPNLSYYIKLYDKIINNYYKNYNRKTVNNNVHIEIEKEINNVYLKPGTYASKFKKLTEKTKQVVGTPQNLELWGKLSDSEFKRVVLNEIKSKIQIIQNNV